MSLAGPPTGPPSDPPFDPPSGPPLGPPPGPPPGRPPELPGSSPHRSGQGVSGRALGAALLLVLAASLLVVTLVLLHGKPHVSVEGVPRDADGLSTGSAPVATEIWCTAAADGTDGFFNNVEDLDDDVVLESGSLSLASDDRGLEAGEVTARCDKARAARGAHALETGLAGVVLGVAGTALARHRRPTGS